MLLFDRKAPLEYVDLPKVDLQQLHCLEILQDGTQCRKKCHYSLELPLGFSSNFVLFW